MQNRTMGTENPRQLKTDPAPNSEFFGDWFYDELMISGSEATREFYRHVIRAATRREPADAE